MKYDDSLFKKLSNGWMADECKVDWKKTDDKELCQYTEWIINDGINPMLKDLGISKTIKFGKVILLDAKVLGLGLILKDSLGATKVAFEEIINNGLDFETKKSNFKTKYPNFENLDVCIDFESEVSAFAAYDNIYINRDIAQNNFGLHLLCHEIMHLYADSRSVECMRANCKMGDEDVNEYFARLASQYLDQKEEYKPYVGSTTLDNMTNNLDGYHNYHGAYGKLLDDRKRFNEMSLDKLKQYAKFYFLNECICKVKQ